MTAYPLDSLHASLDWTGLFMLRSNRVREYWPTSCTWGSQSELSHGNYTHQTYPKCYTVPRFTTQLYSATSNCVCTCICFKIYTRPESGHNSEPIRIGPLPNCSVPDSGRTLFWQTNYRQLPLPSHIFMYKISWLTIRRWPVLMRCQSLKLGNQQGFRWCPAKQSFPTAHCRVLPPSFMFEETPCYTIIRYRAMFRWLVHAAQ